jgi:hypothetical protein
VLGSLHMNVEPEPTPPRASRRWSDLVARRAWLVVFVVAAAAAVPLRLAWSRGAWFTVDDWDFLSERTAGNLGDLFRPHYEHWSTLIVLAYRILWVATGLRYLPYELFAIILYLAVAALILAVMRRAEVDPWIATIAALVVVYLGVGIENNFFTAALVFGLGHLLLADHDGPVGRRDYLGVGAGFAALMCSGLGAAMVFVVGVAMLLRRGWRVALGHTVPLGCAYLVWLGAAPKGQSAASLHASGPSEVLTFAARGLEAGFDRVGQLWGGGALVGLVLLSGLFVTPRRSRTSLLRGRGANAIALLVGAVAFLLLTGAVRSGEGSGVLKGVGPEHARAGRYAYVVAAMAMPILALAVDELVRRWRYVAFLLAALLVVSLPGRVDAFRSAARSFAALNGFNRSLVLSAPRLPLARQLPPDLSVSILGGGGPRLGWLIDSLPSGRIPPAPRLAPVAIASETLTLALRRTATSARASCRRLNGPTVRVLHKGSSLRLESGAAEVVYTPAPGVASIPRPLPLGTVVALAGPLRLRIIPTPRTSGRVTLCG